MNDVITAIRSALGTTATIVGSVPADGWGRPTPCSLWTVRDVTNHLVGGLCIFTDELNRVPARGEHESDWLGSDPVDAYMSAAAADASAWVRPDTLVGTITIGLGTLPAPLASVIHLTEVLVHGVDIAVSIGREDLVDDGACTALLAAMEQMGGVDPYRVPGVFGPAIASGRHEPSQRQLLAYLGREVVSDARADVVA